MTLGARGSLCHCPSRVHVYIATNRIVCYTTQSVLAQTVAIARSPGAKSQWLRKLVPQMATLSSQSARNKRTASSIGLVMVHNSNIGLCTRPLLAAGVTTLFLSMLGELTSGASWLQDMETSMSSAQVSTHRAECGFGTKLVAQAQPLELPQ